MFDVRNGFRLAVSAAFVLLATGAPADELELENRVKVKVALVTCEPASDGIWFFTAGDIDGRRMTFANPAPCSRVLGSLLKRGFELQVPVAMHSDFSPDKAATWTAIALAESGGNTGN